MANFEHLEKAQRTLRANLPPRYFKLDRLERYVDGTQYEGLPDFWNPSEDVPLFERAPAVVYPIVKAAISSNVDLCLGEGRFPSITSNVHENGTVFDDRFGLSEDESEKLDALVRAIVDQTSLKTVCRESLEYAQAASSAVVICCVRAGKLCVETTKAKWCTPEYGYVNGQRELTKLEIRERRISKPDLVRHAPMFKL